MDSADPTTCRITTITDQIIAPLVIIDIIIVALDLHLAIDVAAVIRSSTLVANIKNESILDIKIRSVVINVIYNVRIRNFFNSGRELKDVSMGKLFVVTAALEYIKIKLFEGK